MRLPFYLSLFFLFFHLPAGEGHGAPNAKHIILMISDGQGPKHIEATNSYTGAKPSYQVDQAWTQLWVSTFPFGSSYDTTQAWTVFDYVLSGYTDSAASATALYTGIKTSNGRVSVSHDAADRLFSIAEAAKTLGKGVGAVTTVPVSHATPGVWTSHNDDRGNAYAIADEAFFGDPNTTGLPSEKHYGGGRGPSLPTVDVLIGDRSDGYVNSSIRDKLARESGQPGKFILVERQAGQDGGTNLLKAANDPGTTKLAGLFDQVYHHANGLGFDYENPTLADSTRAALIVLNRNPNGFVLLVEGGAVDWASHANNMDLMIGEQIDFDNAVQTVIDWVENPSNGSSWTNTLVIITADHECGYLTAGVGVFPNVSLGAVNDTTLSLEKIYSGGGGLRASWDDSDNDAVIDAGETVYWAWNSDDHTNTLVPLYARGAGAELFVGLIAGYDTIRGAYIDNTDVYTVMDTVFKSNAGRPEDRNGNSDGGGSGGGGCLMSTVVGRFRLTK
jgi:alkaline phosphatase